jgi:hypothetical protein
MSKVSAFKSHGLFPPAEKKRRTLTAGQRGESARSRASLIPPPRRERSEAAETAAARFTPDVMTRGVAGTKGERMISK